MIRLDGEKVVIEKSSNPIVNEMNEVYLAFEKKFNLKNGGTVNFIYNKEMFPKKVKLYDSKNTFIGTKTQYPASLGMACYAEFTDSKGNIHTIRYYENETKMHGELVMKPSSFNFTGSMSFQLKDKEKLVFLYIFDQYVKSETLKNIFPKVEKENKIIVEDLEGLAIEMLSEEEKWFNIYSMFNSMTESTLRNFALTINEEGAKSKQLTLLKSSILSKLRSDKLIAIKMEEFINGLDNEGTKTIQEIKDIITRALENKKIKCNVSKTTHEVTWLYLDQHGNKGNAIIKFEDTKEDIDKFVAFLEEHEDVLYTLK